METAQESVEMSEMNDKEDVVLYIYMYFIFFHGLVYIYVCVYVYFILFYDLVYIYIDIDTYTPGFCNNMGELREYYT